MARQRMSDRKLRAINRLTGNEYISAWHRGGGDWRWVQCHLPPSGDLLNSDYVNRVTGEVEPLYRQGRPVMLLQVPRELGEWEFSAQELEQVFINRGH